MTVSAFYTGDRGYRQRAGVTSGYGDMPLTSARPYAPRDEMVARNDWPCKFQDCGDRRVTPGQTVIVKRDGKWGHKECPKGQPVETAEKPEVKAARIAKMAAAPLSGSPDARRLSAQVDTANAADALLNEYDDLQRAGRVIPVGNYTIRPADEKTAITLSIGSATFGSFPEGTRKVAMHGSFSVIGDSGLSEARSWYGFATVKPGDLRISLYKNARDIMNAAQAGRPEDQHVRAKLRLAIKCLRLLMDAGQDELMRYGKAYASVESKCWRCDRPLIDEQSQTLGIGPICAKRLSDDVSKRY